MFLLATAVLLLASIILIANTIRLSIFARRREIEVMKLVGATNWFVRGPFMLEGLICGLTGALIAVVLLFVGRELALPAIFSDTIKDAGSDVQRVELRADRGDPGGRGSPARSARVGHHAAALPSRLSGTSSLPIL